ncbi:MAG TPA: putative 2OG-Fe(II) oxygenase [Allosphingosinicella sp.]|jgi:hypothetical protein
MRWASVPSPAQRTALVDLAARTARARPQLPSVQIAWAKALEGSGAQEEALRRLEAACVRFPDEEAVHSAFASALGRAGRIDAALEQTERWAEAGWAGKLQFHLLMQAGRFERAGALEAALAEADPADPDLLEYRALKWRDRPEQLLRACEAVQAADPAAMHPLYHKALALVQLGRGDEAAEAMSLERYLRVVPLGVPPPFENEAAFLAKLGAEIAANPTLHSDPAGHATKRGLRTATFPLPTDEAGQGLVAAIKRTVGEYAAGLSGDHPFALARPSLAAFKSWALLFNARGHQQLHHHPGPWLTGVYYVAAPAGPPRPGALRIGALPAWLEAMPPWPVIDVEPVPGTLVLFPSFVPHETIPSGSDETRISVAFDVARAR